MLLGHDSRSVRALVPDVKVRDRGVHDVTLLDMGDIAGPDVSIPDFVSPLFAVASTCQRWNSCAMSAKSVIAALRPTRVSFCGKRIKLCMSRHVANYHLEIMQLWRCPVSWCTIWKGTPQDCMDHLRLAHAVPASMKTWENGFHHGRFKRRISGVSTDVLLFSECDAPLIHHYRMFAKGISHISLRRSYVTKLQTPRSIRQRDPDDESPHCKARRARSPHKSNVLAVPVSPTAASSRELCPLLYDGRPYYQCRFACLTWWLITSSRQVVCRV